MFKSTHVSLKRSTSEILRYRDMFRLNITYLNSQQLFFGEWKSDYKRHLTPNFL